MRPSAIAAAGLILLAAHMRLCAGERGTLQVSWNELGPHITGHKIALVLPNGTRIEGKVRNVEPEGVRMKVSRTSDRELEPKGERTIPRQFVSVLRVTNYRKLGRLLVTTGAIGVAAGVVSATYPDLYEGSLVVVVPAVVAAGIAGLGVGGYYAGKRLDMTVTEIRVIPERAADSTALAVRP